MDPEHRVKMWKGIAAALAVIFAAYAAPGAVNYTLSEVLAPFIGAQ